MGQYSQFRKYLVSVSVITLSQIASRNTSFECVRTVVSQPMSLPATLTLKLHRQTLHPSKGWGLRDAGWDLGASSEAAAVKAPCPALAWQPKELHNRASDNNMAQIFHVFLALGFEGICKRSWMTLKLYREGYEVLCPTEGYQSVLGRSGDSTLLWMVLHFQEFISSLTTYTR